MYSPECRQIPVQTARWTDTVTVFPLVIACLGLVTAGWVLVEFARNNHTPVVKVIDYVCPKGLPSGAPRALDPGSWIRT